jgi:hypothetical protein
LFVPAEIFDLVITTHDQAKATSIPTSTAAVTHYMNHQSEPTTSKLPDPPTDTSMSSEHEGASSFTPHGMTCIVHAGSACMQIHSGFMTQGTDNQDEYDYI